MIDVENLYRRYGPMVLRRCRNILNDEEKALDAMQETFVKLLRGAERLNDRAPSSLLYCIATNICLNMLRSDRSGKRVDGDGMLEAIASSDDPEGIGIARHVLEGIFRKELPSTRTIAWLHYVDGMTLEETASAVGLSVSGVRKRLAGLKARNKPDGGNRP